MKLTKEELQEMKNRFLENQYCGPDIDNIPALCDMALASLEDDCQGHATQAEMKACKACQAEEPTFTCLTCGEGFDKPTGLGHPACPNCRSINYTDTSEIQPTPPKGGE